MRQMIHIRQTLNILHKRISLIKNVKCNIENMKEFQSFYCFFELLKNVYNVYMRLDFKKAQYFKYFLT